ncbi:hypothetical protein BC831DRAFT_456255 [Entophlyctis helioformis]|nr:hypothetical protein BC831DRAFT_456255 [Entophlyctis helioformis]
MPASTDLCSQIGAQPETAPPLAEAQLPPTIWNDLSAIVRRFVKGKMPAYFPEADDIIKARHFSAASPTAPFSCHTCVPRDKFPRYSPYPTKQQALLQATQSLSRRTTAPSARSTLCSSSEWHLSRLGLGLAMPEVSRLAGVRAPSVSHKRIAKGLKPNTAGSSINRDRRVLKRLLSKLSLTQLLARIDITEFPVQEISSIAELWAEIWHQPLAQASTASPVAPSVASSAVSPAASSVAPSVAPSAVSTIAPSKVTSAAPSVAPPVVPSAVSPVAPSAVASAPEPAQSTAIAPMDVKASRARMRELVSLDDLIARGNL